MITEFPQQSFETISSDLLVRNTSKQWAIDQKLGMLHNKPHFPRAFICVSVEDLEVNLTKTSHSLFQPLIDKQTQKK